MSNSRQTGKPNGFPDFPRFRSSLESEAEEYEIQEGLFAIHDPSAEVREEPVMVLEGDGIRVFSGKPDAALRKRAGLISPVYTLDQTGEPAVPTGRIFLRGQKGTRVKDLADALSAAGFVLEEVLAHAPQAGWVRPASGRIADALSAVDRLRDLPGIENIEPQMLMASEKRSGRAASR